MSSALQARLRAVLLDHPDGLTAREAGDAAGVPRVSAIQALQRMPDVYIDRYMTRPKLPPAAVWVAVAIPPNCPKPPIKFPKKDAPCYFHDQGTEARREMA